MEKNKLLRLSGSANNRKEVYEPDNHYILLS